MGQRSLKGRGSGLWLLEVLMAWGAGGLTCQLPEDVGWDFLGYAKD